MTLDEIALKYNTDKSSTLHNYTEKYEKYFSVIKNSKLKILEIGIQNGYSLKTWKEYFPNSEIFGVDIIDCKHMEEERITTLQGSQTDTVFLAKINEEYGPFDIIIDDGSHNNNDMTISFDFLFPLLRQGGLYVVEDLHCCYWQEFNNGTKTFMSRLKELLDSVNGNGKCGLAEITNIDKDIFYEKKIRGTMDWWEKNLEYIHLYRSIVFIKKNTFDQTNEKPEKKRHPYRISFLLKKLIKKIYAKLESAIKKINEKGTITDLTDYRKKNKIYDCFIFFNELDLLEIRLNILNEFVDYFVLVESTKTFTGNPKPLFFNENKNRFKDFNHKIIHIIVDDMPDSFEELSERIKNSTAIDRTIINDCLTTKNVPRGEIHWLREFYQKEQIKKGLLDAKDADTCYISDLDEIWNPNTGMLIPGNKIFRLRQLMYAYYINNRSSEKWAGTVIASYKNIYQHGINHIRTPGMVTFQYIKNAGWHFTNMGGAEQIRKKLESYGHQEFNTNQIKLEIQNKIDENKDFIGRRFSFWKDETGLPEYIIRNKTQYKELFK